MSSLADHSDDLNPPGSCSVALDAESGAGKTIILGVFVKEPIPGTVKTRLGAEIGCQESAQLYELFVKDLVCRFRSLAQGLVMGYAPNTASAKSWVQGLFGGSSAASGQANLWAQPEGGLGEKITAFFEHAFSSPGAESVVLIGSDSPTIPREYVLQAFEWLYQKDCVIGPSSDGGYYLIGLRKPCKELFQGGDWSEPSV